MAAIALICIESHDQPPIFRPAPSKYVSPTIFARAWSLFRFSLSFARTQLETRPVDMRLIAPLSLLVGVLIHSGKRFLSLSVFLSFLSLSTILIGFSFSRFLYYVAGRSLSALGRLVARKFTAIFSTAMSPINPRVRFVHPELKPQGGCPPLGKLL